MKEKTCKLLVSKSKNVKEYWELLKLDVQSMQKRFSEYFQAISDPNDRFYQPNEDILFLKELQIMFEELNLPISPEEIKDGVTQLRNGESPGPDLFLNEFL